MEHFHLYAVLVVSIICALSCSSASTPKESPDSSVDIPITRYSARPSPPQDARGSPGLRRSVSNNDAISYKCGAGCNEVYGHVVDKTGKKIYVTQTQEEISCSCNVSDQFKGLVKSQTLMPMPQGVLCFTLLRNSSKCMCRQSRKLQRYLKSNQLAEQGEVCERHSNCRCKVSSQFIDYLRRGRRVNLIGFSDRFAENAGQTYDWLAQKGVVVIRQL